MNNKDVLQNESSTNPDRLETDTQKVVRQHLEDKDHVISDADIRNLRVGMAPTADDEKRRDAIEEELYTGKKEKTLEKPVTPWDALKS